MQCVLSSLGGRSLLTSRCFPLRQLPLSPRVPVQTHQVSPISSRLAPTRLLTQLSALSKQANQGFCKQGIAVKPRRFKSNALPFEVEQNVLKDTLVFSYKNDRYFKMITIFGVVQFFFWFHLGFFAYSGFRKIETTESRKLFDEESFWGKVLYMQAKYKDKLAFMSIGVAYAVLFFTMLYPKRSINKMTLLRGGQKVAISTYSHLGRSRHFTVPLEHLNCMHTRTQKGAQLSLKIKDHWFFYLMDKRQGVFHDTKLFDFVIGLQRKI